MQPIKGNYPHTRSLEPRPMKAVDIWAFADSIRRQILGPVHRRAADVRHVAGRTRSLLINGVAYAVVWDFDHEVHDDEGRPVMGVCEHDSEQPDQVMISINSAEVGERPEIERSTALHELGHALFDMPAAVGWKMQPRFHYADGQPRRIFQGASSTGSSEGAMDWREWRANEFMGAFLAPPVPFHQQLVRLANQAELPLVHRPAFGKFGLPVIAGDRVDPGDLCVAVDLLAEAFGVTSEFAWVRIEKYRLLAGKEA